MFGTQYDSDTTTWKNSSNRIRNGSCKTRKCSSWISKTHAVIVTIKRSNSELASYQKKIFKIDSHMGIAIAGLTADARLLSKYMRQECLNNKFVYGSPMQTQRLVVQIADKSQVHTQRYGRRPYGVGLLVVGYDQTGAHLYETCPSGNYYDYKAQSIGARSQSAKTYLEKKFETFENATLDELIKHGLTAIRETLGSATETLY